MTPTTAPDSTSDGNRASGVVPANLPLVTAIGCSLVVLYLVPSFVLGEHTTVRIHDTFEPCVAFQARYASDGDVGFVLGGLPKAAAVGVPRVLSLFHKLFDVLTAYLAWDLAMRLLAFLGMFGLLLRISPRSPLVAMACSVAFAWLPYYNIFGAGIAGLPLLALVVTWILDPNAKATGRVAGVVVIALYPPSSALAVLPFVVAALAATCAAHAILTRHPSLWLFGGAVVFCISAIVTNWTFLATAIGPDPITWHRVEFQSNQLTLEGVKKIIGSALRTQYHADAVTVPFLWCAILAAMLTWRNQTWAIVSWIVYGTVLLIVVVALYVATSSWLHLLAYVAAMVVGVMITPKANSRTEFLIVVGGLAYIAFVMIVWLALDAGLKNLPPLRGFNLTRWYILLPPVYLTMFYCGILRIQSAGQFGEIVSVSLLTCQLAILASQAEWAQPSKRSYMSFADFKAEHVFQQVDALIEKPKNACRVTCVGLYPGTAHLNGYSTVGGYWNLYPIDTKRRMRNVIRGELDKSKELADYFDNWGSRCYVWSSEIGRDHDVRMMETPPERIEHLAIDTSLLSDMGTTHVVSSLPIMNHGDLSLRHLGTVRCEEAVTRPVDVWVYEIVDAAPLQGAN